MSGFLAAAGAAASAIGVNVLNRVLSRLWRVVTTITSYMFMNIFHWTARMFPDQALEIWTTVVDSYYMLPEEWATPIAEYIGAMTGELIDIHDIAGGTMNISRAIGQKFLYPMLNLILPGSHLAPGAPPTRSAKLTPEDGMKGAEMFLATNLHFQMSAWLLHVLGDMQSFGMFKSLKDLPNAISWSYGIGWLSWLVMGVPFRMGISDPMEKFFNYTYRPSELSRKMLIDAMQAGYITREDALERMRYLGWDEDEIAIVFALEREKLTLGELTDMLRYEFVGYEDIVAAYKHRGHDPGEAEALATIMVSKPVDAILERIANEALNLYEDGLLSKQETRKYLEGAYKKDVEINLLFTLAEMRRIPRVAKVALPRSLSPSQIGARYKGALLDRVEAESLLMAIPFQVDQVDLFLDYYRPDEEKVQEPRELGRSVVGALFRVGELTEEQLRADLESMGFAGWQLERLVTYYAPPEALPPVEIPIRKIPATWVFHLHEEGHISTDDAVTRLMTLGISESDARLVLSTLHPVLIPEKLPPRALPASLVGALYRKGLIDATEALRLFVLAGYAMDAAEQLELYYRPVPVVPPVPVVVPPAVPVVPPVPVVPVVPVPVEPLEPDIFEFLPEEVAIAIYGRVLRPTEVGRLMKDHKITWREAFGRVRPDFINDHEVELFFALYTDEMQPPEITRTLSAGVIDYDEALSLALPWFIDVDDARGYLSPYVHV